MNWTAPGAKEWAQKQIGEAKETFFFTASNIVANFTKAVVLQGDEVIGAPIDRNQDGQVSGANSAHVCTLKEGSTEGMDREELPVTFDGLKKLLNEEEVRVSENVGSKATLEGTRHAKEVLTYLGKAEGSTEGMDTEELPVTFDGLNALLNGGEVGVSVNIGSKATVEGTHHAKEVLTLGNAAEEVGLSENVGGSDAIARGPAAIAGIATAAEGTYSAMKLWTHRALHHATAFFTRDKKVDELADSITHNKLMTLLTKIFVPN